MKARRARRRDREPMYAVVLAYDSPSNRRRRRVCTTCRDVGWRIQKSLFEAHLFGDQIPGVVRRIRSVISEDEDSVLVVRLCASCRGQVLRLGRCPSPRLPQAWFIGFEVQDFGDAVESKMAGES